MMIKVNLQKINGIHPNLFKKEDITNCFYNGQENFETVESLDSDDTDYEHVPWIEKFLSIPLMQRIIISEKNKIYNFWCAIDVICCLLSSYYYAYMATWYD